MSGDHAQFFGEGMVITRMVEGEIVKLETIDPEVAARIEMIGKLNDRRMRYVERGQRGALLKLAKEYEQAHMSTMAGMCRKQAREIKTTRRPANGQRARLR